MGEPRKANPWPRLLRGGRKLLPIDGLLPLGYSLPPDVVLMLPTLRCDQTCPYCFQRSADGIAAPVHCLDELGLADWKAIIAQVRPLGSQVIVMGGELFLYPRALELLAAIRDADLPLTVITNGMALPGVAAELGNLGLNRLIVSIDGPAAVNNRLRGHPQGFQRAAQGIDRVIAQRGVCPSPLVQVSCTISVHTQRHLRSFVEHVSPLGVDVIVLNNLIYATSTQVQAQGEVLGQGWGTVQCNTALNHRAELGIDPTILQDELAAIRDGPWSDRVLVAPPGSENHFESYYAPHAPPFALQRCTAVFRELWVLPNGDVAACGLINGVTMGNVLDDGLMAVWNGSPFRRFRQLLAQGLLPACVRCPKLSYHHPPLVRQAHPDQGLP
jgi:radical SAM protein with 4Fe4S-binding SPASM domain